MTMAKLVRRQFTGLTVALLIVLIISMLLALFGVSTFPLLICAAIPWLILASRRFGVSAGTIFVGLVFVWFLLGVLMLLPATGLPLTATIVSIWSVIGLMGLSGIAIAHSSDSYQIKLSRKAASLWVPSLLGPLIWLGSLLAGHFISGASRLSWVMMGDSANNVLFAREIIYRNGISIGPGENPVPLPAGLLALSMDSGRSATKPQDLLEHDITGFAIVWAGLIALTCYFAGVAAAAAVRSERNWLVGVTAAGVSLIPLSWFVTGYPLEFGFFSMHLALPLVLASWLAALFANRSPALAVSSLFLASTLLLAVWSPLVLVPVALGIQVLLTRRGVIMKVRGIKLWFLIGMFVQLLLYAVFITLPSLLAQGGFLSGSGGIFPFSQKLLAAVVIAGIVAVISAWWSRNTVVATALLSLIVSCSVGLGTLLFISRNQPSPWTYYPLKFAWIFEVIALILILGVAVSVVSVVLRNNAVVAALLVLAVGSIFAVNWAPRAVPSYQWMNPIDRIWVGGFLGGGDELAHRIFELSNPEEPAVLWQTGDPDEGAINFWLMQMAADSTTLNHALRVFAYGSYDTSSIDDLCSIVSLMGAETTIYTQDVGLKAEINTKCSVFEGDVIIGSGG